MSDDDTVEFASLLDGVCMLMTRGTYAPNDTATRLFFTALEPYSMKDVRAAFQRHVLTSKFSPTPADLLGYLTPAEADDGRPGAEEAWATALQAADEAATVVWTAETATAWGVARVVFDRGDEVGARMAFREVYTREVASARQAGIRPTWSPSLGYDPARRADALRVATEKGLLQGTGADHLLELAEPRAPVALLEGPGTGMQKGLSPVARAAIQSMREALMASRIPTESADAAARRHTDELRAASDARVAAYLAGNHSEEQPE